MIREAIAKIVNKQDLTFDEAYTVMNEIMSGVARGAFDKERESGDDLGDRRLCRRDARPRGEG